MSKKYGGVIHNWRKQDVTASWPQEELDKQYGPNLGYIVTGILRDDPTGRFGRGPLRTSLVVKFIEGWDGEDYCRQIETLNTIYDLNGPAVEG